MLIGAGTDPAAENPQWLHDYQVFARTTRSG
jgi:hypothetical protein